MAEVERPAGDLKTAMWLLGRRVLGGPQSLKVKVCSGAVTLAIHASSPPTAPTLKAC